MQALVAVLIVAVLAVVLVPASMYTVTEGWQAVITQFGDLVRVRTDAGLYFKLAGSPLAKESTLLIAIDTPEDTFLYAPMATRLAHLVMVDLLSTLVTLARGRSVVERLEYIKESLSDQWIVDHAPPPNPNRKGASGAQSRNSNPRS